jgi:hypothetical protein
VQPTCNAVAIAGSEFTNKFPYRGFGIGNIVLFAVWQGVKPLVPHCRLKTFRDAGPSTGCMPTLPPTARPRGPV